jgi:hypothetical protein
MAQAYLHSLEATSTECIQYQTTLVTDCPCQVDTKEATPALPQDDDHVEPFSSCWFCGTNEEDSLLAFPDKNIAYALVGIDIQGLEVPTGTVITCRQVESFLNILVQQEENNPTNQEICNDARNLLAGICGCPSQAKSPCLYCGTETLPEPDRMIYSFQEYGYPPSTCQDVRLFWQQFEHDDFWCAEVNDYGFLCGCQDEKTNFRNQNLWIPKLSGIISILGSAYILSDILIPKPLSSATTTTTMAASSSRGWSEWCSRLSVFQQLIVCISCCDILGSIGFVLSTIPMPVENKYGEPTGTPGAQGNDATCILQGSLIQFSFTGVLYQISLSTYYLLVICYNWSESRIRKQILWYLHIPLVVGLALTLAGIPFYQDIVWLCWIAPPPLAESYRNTIIFGYVPIGTAALVATGNMLFVYCKVRKQFAAGNRWRMNNATHRHPSTPRPARTDSSSITSWMVPNRYRRYLSRQSQSMDSAGNYSVDTCTAHNSQSASVDLRPASRSRPSQDQPPSTRVSLDRELFWQSLLYLTVFYLSWTMMFLAQIQKYHFHRGLWICISIFSPLQGFNNFLVYIRPRATKRFLKWRLERWKKQRERRLAQELMDLEQRKECEQPSPRSQEDKPELPISDISGGQSTLARNAGDGEEGGGGEEEALTQQQDNETKEGDSNFKAVSCDILEEA